CRRTRCAIRLPPICSITAPTCVSCSSCLATAISPPPRSIPTWPASDCENCTASTTRGVRHPEQLCDAGSGQEEGGPASCSPAVPVARQPKEGYVREACP